MYWCSYCFQKNINSNFTLSRFQNNVTPLLTNVPFWSVSVPKVQVTGDWFAYQSSRQIDIMLFLTSRTPAQYSYTILICIYFQSTMIYVGKPSIKQQILLGLPEVMHLFILYIIHGMNQTDVCLPFSLWNVLLGRC